jgi:hypothetical protein
MLPMEQLPDYLGPVEFNPVISEYFATISSGKFSTTLFFPFFRPTKMLSFLYPLAWPFINLYHMIISSAK